jgi:hypothetical protein
MNNLNNSKRKISFHFQPFQKEDKEFAIEKSDNNGLKRKYLCGISTGPKTDLEKERLTENAVNMIIKQAESEDILLYPDLHGIKASEDIGILTNAKILPDGDWYTEYRLYDEYDEVDQRSIEVADKIWKQSKGLPPYKHPKKKGFSIEGVIPDDGIISAEKDEFGNIGKRVIDKLELDGVVIVPRPAYKDGIANAVFKALGEIPPWEKEILSKSIQGELKSMLDNKELEDQFYSRRWEINDALEKQIEKVMSRKGDLKKEKLEYLFSEFKDLMIDLIMQSENMFQITENIEDDNIDEQVEKNSKLEIYKSLLEELNKFENMFKENRHE